MKQSSNYLKIINKVRDQETMQFFLIQLVRRDKYKK